MEGHLCDWVVGMQKNGLPVNRAAVLTKASDMYRVKYGVTRSTGFLTIRWVSCFLKRHPDLSLRDSQVIKRARNEVTMESLREVFIEYMKHVIERNASSDRVFNMDETGFSQKSRQTKVIAVKGSRNVWSKSTQCNFHLTIVACVSAVGFICPPLYILPANAACGLWSVSLPQQQRRLKLFQGGGCVTDVELPSWLKVRELAQTEIFVLPASSTKAHKPRKTLDVNRRLFTREDLQNIDV
ncbi:hypothetical protein BBJ28_00026262 [Nothophytophthora sp. Chile5]|nr:hypothetical protein BBJ28_00026262 [Nothophytophthora sp. Chile5]